MVHGGRGAGEAEAPRFDDLGGVLSFSNQIRRIHPRYLHRLPRAAARPVDLDRAHLGGLAQTDLQPQGIGPEAPAGVARPVDDPLALRAPAPHPDPRADARPVRLPPLQPQLDPMVPVARVLQQHVRVLVAVVGTPEVFVHVLVAVVVEIREGHRVPLLQRAEPAAGRDILEAPPAVVPEHPVGDERVEIGIAGAEVEIQPAVVVEVAEVRAHGVQHPVQPDDLRHVFEGAVAPVAVEPGPLGRAGHAQQVGHHLAHGPDAVAGHEEVLEPVVVVVEGPAGEGGSLAGHPRRLGHLGEAPAGLLGGRGGFRAVVVEEQAPAVLHRQEEVRPAVVVVVGMHEVESASQALEAHLAGALLEPAVPQVVEETHRVREPDGRRDDIEQAVAVEIVHGDPTVKLGAGEADVRPDVEEAPEVVVRAKDVGGDEPLGGESGRDTPRGSCGPH